MSVSRRRVLQALGVQAVASAALLSQAHELAYAVQDGTAPSFSGVVKRRAMIRRYTDVAVPDELVRQLLSYAARAPSAGNLQPWEFLLVRDPEVRSALADAAFQQNSVATAPVTIVTCAHIQRAGEKFGARGSFYSLVDTAFASLLILLGATEQGLGACFVGSYNPEEVAKLLKLPPYVRPVGLITLGYPAEKPRTPPNPKIPLSQLIHENTW